MELQEEGLSFFEEDQHLIDSSQGLTELQQIERLQEAVSTLQERVDEVEAVAIHQSKKVLNSYNRQIRTVFFGFCSLASLIALVAIADTPVEEKAFSTLATAFGAVAVANSSGALDSIVLDLWKGLKR